jgi:hypothetical protein
MDFDPACHVHDRHQAGVRQARLALL